MKRESKQIEILRLAHAGVAPGDIAEMVGRPINTVYAACWRARKRGEVIPQHAVGRPPNMCQVTIQYPEQHKRKLQDEALRRGISLRALLEKLVNVALEFDMLDNVLDDADEIAAKPALKPAKPPPPTTGVARMIEMARAENKAAHIR